MSMPTVLTAGPLLEPLVRAQNHTMRHHQVERAIRTSLARGSDALGSAQDRLWSCPANREVRSQVPDRRLCKHQGATACKDRWKWVRLLYHSLVEEDTSGSTDKGTDHIWSWPQFVWHFMHWRFTVVQRGCGGETSGMGSDADRSRLHKSMPMMLFAQRRIIMAKLWALSAVAREQSASQTARLFFGLEREGNDMFRNKSCCCCVDMDYVSYGGPRRACWGNRACNRGREQGCRSACPVTIHPRPVWVTQL